MSTNPSLVNTLCESNSKTNFLPICGCFFSRLYQPRSVSCFDGLFVSPPTATIFETRAQKQPLLNQCAVEFHFIPTIIEEVIVFFVP